MSKQVKDKAAVRKRGIIELVAGAAAAGIAILASVASYNAAKAGETYTVYTGFIVLGIAYAVKGIYDLAFPAGIMKNKNSEHDDSSAKAAIPAKDDEVVEED